MKAKHMAALAAAILAACGSSADVAPIATRTGTEQTSEPAERESSPGPAAHAASGLRWALTASPNPVTMAGRAAFRLERRVTNEGASPADAMTPSASFTINGAPSMALDMAFGNGVRESRWAALAPGETVSDARDMGESLFPAPGDYVIAMTTDGVTVTVTVHVTS